MKQDSKAPLEIRPLQTKADLEAFLRVPWPLYRGDPNWVPPLLMERRDHLDPAKNPFFDSAEVAFWLALRGGRPVGRISAQVNRAHLERYDDATGHFGLLEGEERAETFELLLNTAAKWLKAKGMRRMLGPFSLSINDESGLLVEGFDSPPSMMMGHARPYYGRFLEAAGFAKAKDLICYDYAATQELPKSVANFVRKVNDSQGVVIRPLNMRHYDSDLARIIDIFNDAWSDNWGFVPMSDAEIHHLAKSLKPLVNPKSIAIAELDGEAVAMAIGLPNLNEAIADLDGRLLPFGWIKLLWRLKVKTTRTARVPLMGVRKRYHGRPLGAALGFAVIDAIRLAQKAMGVEHAELSWILEDNLPMRRMIEELGGRPYKTYRVYAKPLN